MSSVTGQAHGIAAFQSSRRSAPVKTATTPSAAFAAAVSIDVIRACAYGLRTTAIDDGSRQVDVVDVGSASAQQRIVFLPLQRRADVSCLGGAHAALPAAEATASTMLW